MTRSIRYIAIFIIVLTACSWALLRFDAVQEWAKAKTKDLILHHTGATVEVGHLGGALPFLLTLDDLSFSRPDTGTITIDSISLIPSWLEIMFAKPAFLWITAHGVDAQELHITQTNNDLGAFCIHSLHVSDIRMPKSYYAPLLNSYSEQLAVDCLFSVSGSFSWNPSSKKLSSDITVTPYAADLSPLTVTASIESTPAKTTLDATASALKVPSGSVFFSLPCDRLTIDTQLSANTEDIFSTLQGSWNIHGTIKEAPRTTIQFDVTGKLEAKPGQEIAFSSTDLSCERFEPLLLKREQAALLASSEEPLDPSTFKRTTTLPTPASIEGSVQYKDNTVHGSLIATSITDSIPSCSLQCTITPNMQGSIRLDVLTKKAPITFSTDFAIKDSVSLPNVVVDIAGYQIAGALEATTSSLKGSLKNKETATPLGEVRCEATFNDSMHLEVDVKGYKDSTYSCKKAALKLDYADSILQSELTAYGVECPTLFIDSLTCKHSTKSPFSISLQGKSKHGPCSLDCIGKIDRNLFIIDSCKIDSLGHTITNSTPFNVQLNKHGITLLPFEFTGDNNLHVYGDASITQKDLNMNLTVENLPLECFDPLLKDLTLFGNVSGHCNISGSRQNPRCILRSASSELSFWNPKKSDKSPLTASCEVHVENSLAKVTCEVEGLSLKKPSTLALTLPLQITPKGIALASTKKLTGALQAEFDINSLLTSYFDEEEIMDGIVHVDATLAGTYAKPIVMGTVEWKEGKLFIPCVGTLFSTIQMSGHLDKNQFLIEQLTASDANAGKFEGTGYVRDFLTNSLSYHLQGKVQDFASIALDEVRASSSGDLSLTGNLEHAMLAGSLEVQSAEAILTPSLSKDIPTLDIIYVGKDNDTTAKKAPFQFGLDLNLTMDKGTVRGMGLDSTWKGNAHLKGQGTKIDVDGRIMLTNGTLTFADKTFQLTQGSLDFSGDPLQKSKLQVVAANDRGQISTQIVVLGSLGAPRLVIQSNPAMSEKEILSWLLFNKSSTDITPIEGIQLGKALLQLKGTSGNIDFIEEIKQKLHIDRLDVGPSSSTRPLMNTDAASTSPQDTIPNEVSVQVGKYISDGVIVTLSKDVTNEVNRVGVEANLSKHITAQANVGDDSEAELSLEWKLRY